MAVLTGRRGIMTLSIVVVMQVLTDCGGCNCVGDEDRLCKEAVLRHSSDTRDGYSGDENAHDQDDDDSNDTNIHTALRQKSVIIARH